MRLAEGNLAAARRHRPARFVGLVGGRRGRAGIVALSTASLLLAVTVPTAMSGTVAGADTVASLQQRADALATEIQTDYAKLNVLDEGYNQAHERVVSLQAAAKKAAAAITAAARTLAADKARLRTVAIDAYVSAGTSSGLSVLLSASSKQLPMQQTYMQAAAGNLNEAEASVTAAEHRLAGTQRALRNDERTAAKAEARIASERALALRLTNELERQLSSVKGNLAQAVAAAEHQRQLQAEAAAQAAALAKQQQVSATPPSPPTPPVAGGGSGAVAVRAAESQLGVPYEWGGATPGVGFDCSGLTMWSWAQAGVSLAHGATEQYYEIQHVSMSELRPGDLIFYGNASYLYHVVMYVGSGPYGADTVIQAEQTGTNVMYTPIPSGAYGAGQP